MKSFRFVFFFWATSSRSASCLKLQSYLRDIRVDVAMCSNRWAIEMYVFVSFLFWILASSGMESVQCSVTILRVRLRDSFGVNDWLENYTLNICACVNDRALRITLTTHMKFKMYRMRRSAASVLCVLVTLQIQREQLEWETKLKQVFAFGLWAT